MALLGRKGSLRRFLGDDELGAKVSRVRKRKKKKWLPILGPILQGRVLHSHVGTFGTNRPVQESTRNLVRWVPGRHAEDIRLETHRTRSLVSICIGNSLRRQGKRHFLAKRIKILVMIFMKGSAAIPDATGQQKC